MSLGTTKLCHAAILVKDIEKAVENWSKFLGIAPIPPGIRTIPPHSEVPAFTDGESSDYSDVKLAAFQLDNVVIELAQPGKNAGPWKDKLDRDGEGLQHLSFIVPDRRKAQDALTELGAPAAYHIGYWPGGTYAFTDAVDQLGVEINIKTDDDNREKIKKVLADPDSHKADL
ncbi:lactoylglutathione lyase [Spirochaetia bacterium]|nr:lactoylglutathione lyase [Spirochaetia bacterium]GHU32257.1 lactoylglutathione lyase [Spirochaetia bacterium]